MHEAIYLLIQNSCLRDSCSIFNESGNIEVLAVLELDGTDYYALVPANTEDDEDLEVSILKSVEEEDGEPILCAVEDEIELETVYNLIMDQIYEEEEE